jgi:hypothetical protein
MRSIEVRYRPELEPDTLEELRGALYVIAMLTGEVPEDR